MFDLKQTFLTYQTKQKPRMFSVCPVLFPLFFLPGHQPSQKTPYRCHILAQSWFLCKLKSCFIKMCASILTTLIFFLLAFGESVSFCCSCTEMRCFSPGSPPPRAGQGEGHQKLWRGQHDGEHQWDLNVTFKLCEKVFLGLSLPLRMDTPVVISFLSLLPTK